MNILLGVSKSILVFIVPTAIIGYGDMLVNMYNNKHGQISMKYNKEKNEWENVLIKKDDRIIINDFERIAHESKIEGIRRTINTYCIILSFLSLLFVAII